MQKQHLARVTAHTSTVSPLITLPHNLFLVICLQRKIMYMMVSTDLQIGGKQSKQSIYKVFRKTIVKPGMNPMNKYD